MLPRRSHTPGTPPPGNGRAGLPPLPQPGLQLAQAPADTAGGQGGAPCLPAVLTVREAAQYLRISERSLWALSTPRGVIPALRYGRAVRYRRVDLQEWLAEQAEAARQSGAIE